MRTLSCMWSLEVVAMLSKFINENPTNKNPTKACISMYKSKLVNLKIFSMDENSWP